MKNNEKGIAIPTVLVALVALTALGVAMSVATQSEVEVSSIQQKSLQSFHAADGGVNFSLGLAVNFANPGDRAPYNTATDYNLPFNATVGVTFLPPARLPPPGLRVSALKVSSFHFLMNSTGQVTGASGAPASVTGVEMEASKLGPSLPTA